MIKSTQFVVNDMIVDFCGQKYHLKQESAKNSRNPIPSGRVLGENRRFEFKCQTGWLRDNSLLWFFILLIKTKLSDKWVCGKRVSLTPNLVPFQKFWFVSNAVWS